MAPPMQSGTSRKVRYFIASESNDSVSSSAAVEVPNRKSGMPFDQ